MAIQQNSENKQTDQQKQKSASARVKSDKKTGNKDSLATTEENSTKDTTTDKVAYRPQLQRKPERYVEAVGRRKTSVARVRLFTKTGEYTVNNRTMEEYFPTFETRKIVQDALQKMKLLGRFRVSVKVSGGGYHSQAEAIRHGLARCLVKFNPDFRKRLKRAGFLTRDPRVKERKKPGLIKARKAPQWSKR